MAPFRRQNKGGNPTSIKIFADKFIKAEHEAWIKGRFESLQALEAPRAVYNFTPPFALVGWKAHKQQITEFRHAFSGLRVEWKYLTGDGSLFALSFKMNGTYTGQLPGFAKPEGQKVSVDGLFLFRVKNNKIAEAWSRSIMKGLSLPDSPGQ